MAKKFFIFSLLCLLAIAAQALLPRPGHIGQPRQNKLPGPGPERDLGQPGQLRGEPLSLLRDRLRCPKEIHAVEGVNHLFQHCKMGDFSEYKEIEETIGPEALALIADWMQQFK